MELVLITTEADVIPEVMWNFEEMKAQIQMHTEKYNGLHYTEDQMKDAKADLANLNKLEKALAGQEKSVKNMLLAPYHKFQEEIKELQGIVKNASSQIKQQTDAVEEKRLIERAAHIEETFGIVFEGYDDVQLKSIYQDKWTNKGTTMAAIKKEMIAKRELLISGLETLDTMTMEDKATVIAVLIRTFDIAEALKAYTIQEENKRIAERQREKAEAKKAEEKLAEEKRLAEQANYTASNPVIEKPAPAPAPAPVEPVQVPSTEPVQKKADIIEATLVVSGTREQLVSLVQYMKASNITFTKVG